jgi:hypothetical protein
MDITPDSIRKRLIAHGNWPLVSKMTGVSESWLSKFANKRTDNPRYNTLKRLHDYLKTKRTPSTS